MPRTLEILGELVAFPTVGGRARESCVAYLSDVLAATGSRVVRVPSPLGDCEGLVASLGPDQPWGVLLSGHLDVVGAEGQAWATDPFALIKRGGRVFGRGTADMKGFLACALAVFEALSRKQLDRPLHLAISGDEETTCRSAEALAAHVAKHLPPVRGVMIGEPTGLRAANRHRGSYTVAVEVLGKAAHASRPELGMSAIGLAARLIAWLEDGAGTKADGRTSHSVGTIAGGTASNVIAERCRFEWDVRCAPSGRIDDILSAFRREAEGLLAGSRERMPEAAITATVVGAFPGFQTAEDAPFAQECARLAREPGFIEFAGGTEAGLYAAHGFPVIVIGPGDLGEAHTADESVSLEDLADCCTRLRQLA